MGAPTSCWQCFDHIFGFPEVRELRAGVLDPDAEHVFTSGHCHSFAEALRRLARCQLIFAFDRPAEGWEDGVQGHVFVRIAGRHLDARGWIDERLEGPDPDRALAAQWDQIREIGPEGWLANSHGWLEPRVDDALPFAAALLGRLQVPLDGRRGGARRPAPVTETNHRPRGALRPHGPHTKEVHLEREPDPSGSQPSRHAGAAGNRPRSRSG